MQILEGFRTGQGIRAEAWRRWAFPYSGDLWQSVVLHGPAVRDERGRLHKTYLLVTLDDATRVVPHGEFKFSEKAPAFLQVFREEIQRRGIPKHLYVDRGACYRSRQLDIICARLGVALIHARAFHAPGKPNVQRRYGLWARLKGHGVRLSLRYAFWGQRAWATRPGRCCGLQVAMQTKQWQNEEGWRTGCQ